MSAKRWKTAGVRVCMWVCIHDTKCNMRAFRLTQLCLPSCDPSDVVAWMQLFACSVARRHLQRTGWDAMPSKWRQNYRLMWHWIKSQWNNFTSIPHFISLSLCASCLRRAFFHMNSMCIRKQQTKREKKVPKQGDILSLRIKIHSISLSPYQFGNIYLRIILVDKGRCVLLLRVLQSYSTQHKDCFIISYPAAGCSSNAEDISESLQMRVWS